MDEKNKKKDDNDFEKLSKKTTVNNIGKSK